MEEAIDREEVVFETRPDAIRLGAFLLLGLFLNGVYFLTCAGVFQNPERLKEQDTFERVAFTGVIVLVPVGIYIIFSFFFMLRGFWTLRATPEGVVYRGWFSTVVIPWDDIAGFCVYEAIFFNWLRFKKKSFDIVLRKNAPIWRMLPASMRILAKTNLDRLSVRRSWTYYPPDFLEYRFEQYRQRYSELR